MQNITNPDIFRDDIRNNILKKICENKAAMSTSGSDKKSPTEMKKLATNIEKSVYNFAIKEATTRKVVKKWSNMFFVQLYIDRLRSIYLNLRGDFLQHVLSGEIATEQIANMSHFEMAPEQWAELIQNKIRKETNKYNVDDGVYSDMFQCKKCKSRQVKYFEMQTRSADEPCTVFCSCINGHNWRIN